MLETRPQTLHPMLKDPLVADPEVHGKQRIVLGQDDGIGLMSAFIGLGVRMYFALWLGMQGFR